MKIIPKGLDYKAFVQITNSEGEPITLSEFSNYKLELRSSSEKLIRTLELDNTAEQGKLIMYDEYTLQYYLETRDTNLNSIIKVYILTETPNSEISDGIFNTKILMEVFKIV